MDLSSINLLAVIGSDTHLKKVAGTNGGEYCGSCPFCGGEDRFRVQPHAKGGGRWFCRHCSGFNDAIGYLRKKGLSFQEALEQLNLAGDYKPMPRPNLKRSIALAPALAPMPIQESWLLDWTNQLMANADLVEYLGKRGVIDPEEYRIGYTGHDKRLSKEWMRDKLVIPHYHDGKLTAIKLRNNPHTTGGGYITLSDEHDPLIGKSSYALPYNVDAIAKSKIACGIESELDVIAFAQQLGVNFCGVPAGATKQGDKWTCHSFRSYYVDYFLHCEKVVWFCDGDASGHAFARAIQSVIGIAEVYFPPKPYKDFSDFYRVDKESCIRIMKDAIYN